LTECFAFCSIGAVGVGTQRKFSVFARNRYLDKQVDTSCSRCQGLFFLPFKRSFLSIPSTVKDYTMKLYVGNLSYRTTEADLRREFERYGNVDSVDMIIDRETGRSKGFAFVEMSDNNQANEAIRALDGAELGDRTLKVNEAQPKNDRSGGGGGRGFGGGGGKKFGGGGGGNRDRRY